MTHIHAILQAIGFNLVALVAVCLILLVGLIIGFFMAAAIVSPDPLPDERQVYLDLCRIREDLCKMEKERDSFREKLFINRQQTSFRMPSREADTLSEHYGEFFDIVPLQDRFKVPSFEAATSLCWITRSNYRGTKEQNECILKALKCVEHRSVYMPNAARCPGGIFPPAFFMGFDMATPNGDHSAVPIIKKLNGEGKFEVIDLDKAPQPAVAVEEETLTIKKQPEIPVRKPKNMTDEMILATEREYGDMYTGLEKEEKKRLAQIRSMGSRSGLGSTIPTRFEIEKK